MTVKNQFDLAIVRSWIYDQDFSDRIERIFQDGNLSTYIVHAGNVDETLRGLKQGTLIFRSVLDRASDESEAFLPLARWIEKRHEAEIPDRIYMINKRTLLLRAADKATMHLEFLAHHLHVPYTIIISPYNTKREPGLSLSTLAQLGRPFIIKPANTTGGGIGVVMGAESLRDVLDARQHHKNDKYLLQETVRPVMLGDRQAWFRVFYAFGRILPCWWNETTHVNEAVSHLEEERFSLVEIRRVTEVIHEVCQLEFFSTEIALTQDGRFVVVDYVNEMCDMRFKSRHPDGVPEEVVSEIILALREFVGSLR